MQEIIPCLCIVPLVPVIDIVATPLASTQAAALRVSSVEPVCDRNKHTSLPGVNLPRRERGKERERERERRERERGRERRERGRERERGGGNKIKHWSERKRHTHTHVITN